MKVKELFEFLSGCDPEAEVFLVNTDGTDASGISEAQIEDDGSVSLITHEVSE